MTKEQELELAISCLHYLTDEGKKKAGKDLGELVKKYYIEDLKNELPWCDKEWLNSNVKVFVGTLRSDAHMGSFKIEIDNKLNSEIRFRIRGSMMKDQRSSIYELEIKWDFEVRSYWLVKDGTGYIREALDTDGDFIKRYKEPTPNVEEIIGNTVEETLSKFKNLDSTAFAIKKLIKDNNCCLKVMDGKVYLQHLNYLTILN
jgi:hypothetical protein